MAVTWGTHGPVYDWWNPDTALECTGLSDNFHTYYSFDTNWGYGWRGWNMVGFQGEWAFVFAGIREMNDRGMGAIFGLHYINVKRDSISSKYGNIGAGAIYRWVPAANGIGTYPDPSGHCNPHITCDNEQNGWVIRGNGDTDQGGTVKNHTNCSFVWLNGQTVTWGLSKALVYMCANGAVKVELRKFPSGETVSSDYSWFPSVRRNQCFKCGLPSPLKAINSSNDLQNAAPSQACWPRIYWNKRGMAGVNNSETNSRTIPTGHGDDNKPNHTKMWIHMTIYSMGSGPRLGRERAYTDTMDGIVYIPDVPGKLCGWLYAPGTGAGGSVWISAGTVTETTIDLSYGAGMPSANAMLGYDFNDVGRYRVEGSRYSGWSYLNPSASSSQWWQVSGLSPDTVYSFRTYAQSNPSSYSPRDGSYSGWVSRRTMAKPGAPVNHQYSKWDTPRVRVTVSYWGNDIAYPTNAANTTQVVDYVFNQSSTDTSGYSTTGRVGGEVIIQAPWHSTNQNSGFWVHTRTRNAWGVSPWVHTWFETVDRLYRPGSRRQSNWKSHQSVGGKSHRFTGSWTEMTTRSEYRPDGRLHADDDPQRKNDTKWRNQELEGTDITFYPENDFYP